MTRWMKLIRSIIFFVVCGLITFSLDWHWQLMFCAGYLYHSMEELISGEIDFRKMKKNLEEK